MDQKKLPSTRVSPKLFVPSNHKMPGQKTRRITTVSMKAETVLVTCNLGSENQENGSSKEPSTNTICYILLPRTSVPLKQRFEEQRK